MTETYILAHYPRLIQSCMYVACLSEREAVACIRDYAAGLSYSGEAVNHFGGTKAVLGAASRQRVRHFMLDHRAWQRAARLDTTYQPADYRSLGG